MSCITIADGTGQGYQARVNSDNQLVTRSITRSEAIHAAEEDRGFTIGSGLITLTSGNPSAVLFIKNLEQEDLIVNASNIYSSKQTGSSAGTFKLLVYRNGTGLSAGTSLSALTTTFGSTTTLSAAITGGQEGATVTNGTATGAYIFPEAQFQELELAWRLPKGQSIAAVVIPGSGNTSMEVGITLEVYKQDTSLVKGA